MQQSSATQSLHLSFWGLRKIVACSHSSSQCLLVSTVFGTVSSLHPTSFLMIFILVNYSNDAGLPVSPCIPNRIPMLKTGPKLDYGKVVKIVEVHFQH